MSNTQSALLSHRQPAVTSKQHLPVLDGYRFIAALFVLFSHASHTLIHFSDTIFWKTVGNTVVWIGMSLFFVLSGFVIHYNYSDLFRQGIQLNALYKFSCARFSRLYPLFFFFLIIALATTPIYGPLIPNNAYSLLFFVSLTQSWLPITTDFDSHMLLQSFYPHSWSISTEMFFYLMYPLLALIFLRLNRARSIIICIVTFIVASYSGLIAIYKHKTGLTNYAFRSFSIEASSDQFIFWLGYYSPYVRILEFILGCLTAQLYLALINSIPSKNEQRYGNIALATAFLTIVAIQIMIPSDENGVLSFVKSNFLYAPMICIVLFCSCRYKTLQGQIIGNKVFVALGGVSYSIYLIHPWILNLFAYPAEQLVSGPLLIEWYLRMCMALLFTIILSFATYRMIESPLRRYLRNIFQQISSPQNYRFTQIALVATLLIVPVLGMVFGLSAMYGNIQNVYYQRGLAKENRNDYDGAYAEYNTAISMGYRRADCFYHRGMIKIVKQHYSAAISDFDCAVRKDPNNYLTFYNRGFANQALRQYDRAILDFQTSIKLNHRFTAAADSLQQCLSSYYYQQGLELERLNDYERAIAQYNIAIEKGLDKAECHYHRGLIHTRQGDYTAAIIDFDHAATKDPSNPLIYFNRGFAKQSIYHFQEAISDYERALQWDPKMEAALSCRHSCIVTLTPPLENK